MTEKDKKIQELEQLKQWIMNFIENKCAYDEHLQGYCFPLSKSDVRTLMYKLKGDENEK